MSSSIASIEHEISFSQEGQFLIIALTFTITYQNGWTNGGLMDATPTSLLHRLSASPTDADWQVFVERFTPLLYGLMRRRFHLQEADACDLLQDIFSHLIQKLPEFTYDRKRSFRGWVTTMCKHRYATWYRQRKPEQLESGEYPDPATLEPTELLGEPDYRAHLLQQLLKEVQTVFSKEKYDVFCQVKLEGKSPTAVAAETGISRGQIYTDNSRIMSYLREHLSGFFDDVEPPFPRSPFSD